MANVADEKAILNKPTFLEHNNQRFLIMDSPNDANLEAYIPVLQKRHVLAVARACEPCYDCGPLNRAKIRVEDLAFPDGDPPPADVVKRWLGLVHDIFGKKAGKESTIAVHCVAGLGRAPVLVAIALVEYGMEPLDAVAFIRKRRRGAINARQLKFLEGYKRQGGPPGGCCVIC